MLILGLQGSPRKSGNTSYLLKTFLQEAKAYSANTQSIQVPKKEINPCTGCGVCEKTGDCIFEDDDMTRELYPLLRKADIIVAATPIYFYSTTAQMKALIDRSQALWARKYALNLTDPGNANRLGFLLALGATKGKNLFEGINLTAKYFFDAIGAKFTGSLTYRRVESKGDMEKHPQVHEDIKKSVKKLLSPLIDRKKVLFACIGNTCRSQMAGAFAQKLAGVRIEVLSGGSAPENAINPLMTEAMSEIGIDMAYRIPGSIEQAVSGGDPEIIVTMGCGEACPHIPGAKYEDWDIQDPIGQPLDFMKKTRDEIEKRVISLLERL